MAKKSTRQIPAVILNVVGDGKPDTEMLCSTEGFVNAVFIETVEGIKDAINTNKRTAVLFEVGKSDYYIEISKNQWKQALQTCIDRLVEIEKYEECFKIKQLIDKIK
jgi:hypothetical protein